MRSPAGADRTDCHIGVTRINRDTIAAASRGAGAISGSIARSPYIRDGEDSSHETGFSDLVMALSVSHLSARLTVRAFGPFHCGIDGIFEIVRVVSRPVVCIGEVHAKSPERTLRSVSPR